MEVKLSGNIKPNKNPFSFLLKIISYIAAFFKFVGKGFSMLWDKLCENKSFARFVYIIFPALKKKIWSYIKKHRYRIIIPAAVGVVALAVMLIVMLKNTENSDYYIEGNDEIGFGMVLQHYSTFDHSEKLHIGVKLSWEDGAVNLNDGTAQARIKAKVYPVNLQNRTITWKSSDKNIAEIDSSGNITAKNPGTVNITASLSAYGKSSQASLAVRQPVSGLFMPTSTITLYTGGTGRLLSTRVFPSNATNQNIIWKSKNNKIASVDGNGRVTPVSVGMTEITASTEDGGFEAKCFVNVVNAAVNVDTISLRNEDAMRIKVGESVNAIVTVSPSNARNKTLKWSSDNEEIVSVSQIGRIRGKSVGTANVTVQSVNGKKYTFAVEVTDTDEKDPFNLNGVLEELPADGTVTYTSYDTTFPQAVRIQMSQSTPPKIWRSSGVVNATEAETAEYMNPSNYYTDAYKYQFLDLSRTNNVSEELLNSYLADKGVLRGMGAVFIEAAKEYNVSEVYLVAHACLESGNGTSRLATGVDVNGTTVYNLFGINAYDANPLGGGSSKAYSEGWTSVEKAIRGGARWISQYYVNRAGNRQNTLYKMLWNPEQPGEHQYATDVGWAVKQAISIEKIFAEFADASLSYDVPVYSGQIPPTVGAE